MKIIFNFLLFILFLSNNGFGQSILSNLSFQFRPSINFNSDHSLSQKKRPLIQAATLNNWIGLSYANKLNKNWKSSFCEIELLYSTLKSRSSYEYEASSNSLGRISEVRIPTIVVPLNYKHVINRHSFCGGLFLAYKFKGKFMNTVYYHSWDIDYYKFTDHLIAGAQFKYGFEVLKTETIKLGLEPYYFFRFKNIFGGVNNSRDNFGLGLKVTRI